MKIISFKGGYDRNFSYIIHSNNEAIVIDPFSSIKILNCLKKNNLQLKYIINTHSHFDHIEGNVYFQKNTNAKIIPLDINDKITLNNLKISFILTPGHTSDSRCILINNKYLFTGDTLFVNSIGSCAEKDYPALLSSIKKLSLLSPEIIIYPGHDYGPNPTSTIKKEKQLNPFLQLIR